MKFDAIGIMEAIGGRLLSGSLTKELGSICSDIKDLQRGQWFIALPDDRTDGHDLLHEAFDRGAIGCIVVDNRRYPFLDVESQNSLPILIGVPSTLHAYYQLAILSRKIINPKVIAITGSSGKSTTREMLCNILSIAYKTHAAETSRPDARGLAKKLLELPDSTEVLVVELSQRGRGQIAWLAAGMSPDIAVITNIGLAHLETLGSIENIAAAKCEILESLSLETGLAIIGDENDLLTERANLVFAGGRISTFTQADIEVVGVKPNSTLFVISGSDTLFDLNSHGVAYLRDAWCAINCARQLGLPDYKIAEGLRRYDPERGRGNKTVGRNGATIVDESYSANPDSVRSSVCAFLDTRAFPQLRKFIVLGAMLELGEASADIHAKLGQWLSTQSFECLITIGETAAQITRGANGANFKAFASINAIEAYRLLAATVDENTSVLIDGSDCPELRLLVQLLTAADADVQIIDKISKTI
ncbi:MAG: UDP-N-acetylmuramoyl-tripeptide--D-alanyl-D-alanine ligase [Candidatus Melainabacteria bacterium]|nr:UDP-N-acetylmuramoyl-tripeptide--D-alanyl-D-alanine ligase [Candidatus Melainabacteria bacterium]